MQDNSWTGARCADAVAQMQMRMETNSVVQDASMKGREVFWEKLRLQILTHLSQVYCHRRYAERPLTVQELLCHIGIDALKHFSSGTFLPPLEPSLLELVIPERRYWYHWLQYWPRILEPSEINVVLGIAGYTTYIASVCDTCKEALESQGYRIHPEYGVQLKYRDHVGNVSWWP